MNAKNAAVKRVTVKTVRWTCPAGHIHISKDTALKCSLEALRAKKKTNNWDAERQLQLAEEVDSGAKSIQNKAKELGLSVSYLKQLCSQGRKIRKVREKFKARILLHHQEMSQFKIDHGFWPLRLWETEHPNQWEEVLEDGSARVLYMGWRENEQQWIDADKEDAYRRQIVLDLAKNARRFNAMRDAVPASVEELGPRQESVSIDFDLSKQ